MVHQPYRWPYHIFRIALPAIQGAANKAPPPVSYDLFDVKQYQGETLKKYINRFGVQVVKVGTTEEPMIVYTFRKGVCLGLSASQSFATAPELLLRYGVVLWNTSPLRARCARSAQALHPHAREHRRVHNLPGSTRLRREGRTRRGNAHTRRGGPKLGSSRGKPAGEERK